MPPKGRHWRTEQAKYETLLKDGRIVFGKTGRTKPQLKVFLSEVKDKGAVSNSWLDADVYDTSTNGKKELIALFPNEEVFDTPKPKKLYVELLRLILSPLISKPIVLDFFAGSGTTGHAVMEYNKLFKQKVEFVLATNNQNGICRDVTYERISRAIEKDGYSASLKYYKIDYIPISDRVYYEYADELLRHVKELVELENGINFTGNAEIAIVLTDDEIEAFINNMDEYEKCRRLYRGHDILLSAEQEAKLQERDITVCVIPDYYYRELEGGK